MNKNRLLFVLPSLLGVLFFLTPIPWNGNSTIVIGIITAWLKSLMGDYGLHIVVGLTVLTSVLTLLGTVLHVRWIVQHPKLKDLFDVPPIWLVIRLLGTAFGLIYLFQIGPDVLTSDAIGGVVFIDIGVNVIPVYIVACLLLPFLTDFGFMEFTGTLARPLFRKVFQLPGRSAVDAITSFVGASSIGCLITIGQYNNGNYTAREAGVIATNFSVVSIPFCLVVVNVAGIEQYFIPWYGVVISTCVMAAIITSRLPPLSKKADAYIGGEPGKTIDRSADSGSLLREAWVKALARAENAPGIKEFLTTGLSNMMFFMFSILTAAMALATLASLVTFHTPIFSWLGYPFITLLELAQLPDAALAATALFSGFLDQYMPAIIAAGIDSDTTSFVLAGLSVCQLIFMSELGVVILRSSLPLSLLDLAAIFLLRTVIVLPMLILGAHFVVN